MAIVCEILFKCWHGVSLKQVCSTLGENGGDSRPRRCSCFCDCSWLELLTFSLYLAPAAGISSGCLIKRVNIQVVAHYLLLCLHSH